MPMLAIANALVMPPTITLVPLPLYSPKLNLMERFCRLLRERFLSHRVLDAYDGIAEACCQPWTPLTPERLRSVTFQSWVKQVIS